MAATAGSMGQVLYEREAELASLERALADAMAGIGRTVLIEASPGIGKTQLLDEVCRMAEGRARVLRARGGEQEQRIPLLVTRELFTPLVRASSDADLDRWFAGAAELAGPLVGRGTTSAAESDFALVHGIYWLIANLADDGPLLLAIDDLHWVDEATQRWIAYLLPRLAELPVLLALPVRPRELDPASPAALGLAGHHDATTLRPHALGAAAAALVLRDSLAMPDPDFCRAAHQSTGGNPLLLRRLATAVADAGITPDADGARRLDEIGSLSIGRIVLPRLHALGPEACRLARAIAVLGDGCTLALAAALADLDREDAATRLDALVDKEIVHASPEPAFTHPLVRATVLDEVADGSRRLLRLRAARILHERGADPEDIAPHLAATDPVGEPWAAEALRQAAQKATASGSPAAAVTHLATALREPLDSTTRFGLLLDAGWQAFRSGDLRAGDWLGEALRIAPDPASAVIAWTALTNWKIVFNDDPASVLDGLPADLDEVDSLTVKGIFLIDFGFSSVNGRSLVTTDLKVSPELMNAVPQWWCGLAADEAMTGGDAGAALEFVRRANPDQLLTRMASDSGIMAWLLVAVLAAGDLDEYERLTRAALDDATRRGSFVSSEWFTMMLAVGQLARGEMAAAESTVVTWLENSPDPLVPVTLPSWLAIQIQIHLERARTDAARDLLSRFALLDANPRPDAHGAHLLVQRGRVRQTVGDLDAALRDYRAAEQVLDSFGCRDSTWAVWRPGAATCLARLGRADEARVLAEEQVAAARGFAARPLLGTSLRTLGSIIGGLDGIALVEEAVDVLDGSGAKGEHTSALLDLGRLLRLDRKPARAKEHLQRGLDQADRNGALLLASEIEEELHLCGARPRRRAITGVHSLTPAELRVATLAAQGHSNPEIAQSLFVTRKTVEKHLGSVFQKLHVSSRDQLPAVLDSSA